MTKLQNLFVALVNMDISFEMTLKFNYMVVYVDMQNVFKYAVSGPFELLLNLTFSKLKPVYGQAPDPC